MKELTTEQKKQIEAVNKKEPVNIDEFNKIMEGTGIKIIEKVLDTKEIESKVKKYANELKEKGYSKRNIRRKIKQKFNINVNLK